MLSVIIATRDSERALVPTLAALVSGATAGLVSEVLVVDGGSRDDTAKVADVAGCNFHGPGRPAGAPAQGRGCGGARPLAAISAARNRKSGRLARQTSRFLEQAPRNSPRCRIPAGNSRSSVASRCVIAHRRGCVRSKTACRAGARDLETALRSARRAFRNRRRSRGRAVAPDRPARVVTLPPAPSRQLYKTLMTKSSICRSLQGMTASQQRQRRIAAVRRFNRFYTRRLGVLRKTYLDSPVSAWRGARALRDRQRPYADGQRASAGRSISMPDI